MRALVLDSGALLALERDHRPTWIQLRTAVRDRATVQVPAGALAQAWRDGRRQVRLATALRHCDEVPLDGAAARAAGMLCAATGTSDVVDASVAVTAATLARHGPTAVLTSDPDDLRRLLIELKSEVVVARV